MNQSKPKVELKDELDAKSINEYDTEASNNFEMLKDRELKKKQSSIITCCMACKIICWERLSKSNKVMAALSTILILLVIAYLLYSIFIHR